jgi:hypothetical protein
MSKFKSKIKWASYKLYFDLSAFWVFLFFDKIECSGTEKLLAGHLGVLGTAWITVHGTKICGIIVIGSFSYLCLVLPQTV